jgi:poly(A) polymerase
MTEQLTPSPLPALPPPLPPPEIDPSHLITDSLKVVARLRRHGHVAYLVGGCVRDLLVGVMPKDYDVATSAHPDQIRDVFRNSRLIGRRFRLAHVYFQDGNFIEVATFRASPVPEPDTGTDEPADLLLTDDNQFGTAEEDARRRDFTINGLFYDVIDGRVIDFVGGREDLVKRQLRTIGDPEIRLREDPVRGLRAARIAAKLGFTIEEGTFAAMTRHADELPRCAPARVLEETLKLLRSGASSRAFALLRRAGILRVLLPPIEEVLVQGGATAEASFLARLSALDAMLAEGEAVSDAVMLSALLSFLPGREIIRQPETDSEADEEPDDLSAVLPSADQVLAQMSVHARLPRRVADRVRMIIGSQRIFHAPVKKKRRRTGGFVRTQHFAEALQLLALNVRATGENAEVLQRWQVRAHSAVASAEAAHAREPVAEAPAASEAPRAKASAPDEPVAANVESDADKSAKRRRRGGRRHRKGQKPDAAGETPPTDGAPTT